MARGGPLRLSHLRAMFWGRLSDLDGHTGRVLRVTAIGSAIGFLPTLATADFWIIMASTAVFHFFREGIVPAADTAAIVHTRRYGGTFGGHRIWGSIGFIVTVLMSTSHTYRLLR